MPAGTTEERWIAELRQLREELDALRREQKEMATAIRQLVTTFQSLATHMGIAAEPYSRKGARSSGSDDPLPGFG